MLRVLNVSKSGFYAWLKRLNFLSPAEFEQSRAA